MEHQSEILHQFLSDVFGDIQKREEDSLAAGDLSLREVQLIDAVCRTVDQGGDNRSTAIAAARRMAAGTLTSAVDLLVKKGYLIRLRDGKDRRVVRLMPTQQGRDASERHRAFHRRITDSLPGGLCPDAGDGETHRFLPGRMAGPGQSDHNSADKVRLFMSKIAIATDSNSGITQAQGKELGIFVLPMPFYINDELFLEDITLSQEQFYQRLEEGADVKTTQPSPGDVTDLWDKILQEYDQIVYIPMSSGLSSSCETAMMLSQEYEGKVFVVNNQRISVTQRQAVLDAQVMAQAGKSAQEIHDYLERTKFDSDIYITVDTLKYLKKGGRCTPAAAALGAVLGIKPVLRIKGEKLDSFAKVRGWKAAKKTMVDAIRNTMDTDACPVRSSSTSPPPTPASAPTRRSG